MRRLGVRFKAWTLLVAVAIVAVLLAAARGESGPGTMIAIIGACICYLAYERYAEVVSLRRARGLTTSRSQKAFLILASAIIAVSVIGLSDIAFLAGYCGFLKVAYETVVVSHWTPYNDSGYMGIGVVIGVVFALAVASCLRRNVWTEDRTVSRFPGRWLKLWPAILAVLITLALGLEEMRQRWRFCTMMADYHASAEWRAANPKKAALHALLKRWYQKVALRPWLPIHPDQIRPEL